MARIRSPCLGDGLPASKAARPRWSCRSSSIGYASGPCQSIRPVSRFFDRTGRLDPRADAGTQVAPEAIAPLIAELKARVSSVTLSKTIYKVRRAAECIAPHLDLAWLAEIGKDLALLERPKEDFARIVAPERLVEAGLTLIREAERDTKGSRLKRAVVVRNGLMVALLAFCPVRLRNFASLKIGQTFVRQAQHSDPRITQEHYIRASSYQLRRILRT